METTKTIPTIIDSTVDELHIICSEFLKRFDDYQQIAHDMGLEDEIYYYVNAYHELERIKEDIMYWNKANGTTRTTIRMLVKDTEKHASITLFKEKSYEDFLKE